MGKSDCILLSNHIVWIISYVLVCDWQSLYLVTTLHKIFEKISPLFHNRKFRHCLRMFLRRRSIWQYSHKLGVFLVSLRHPETWGIRRWVLHVIIINNVSFFIGWTIPLLSFLHDHTVRKKPCLVVYYESIKREIKIKPVYKCRCDERLQTKTKRFTLFSYTGLVVELEHLKIKTRLTEGWVWDLDVIVVPSRLRLIRKVADLASRFPLFDLRFEKNTARRKWVPAE